MHTNICPECDNPNRHRASSAGTIRRCKHCGYEYKVSADPTAVVGVLLVVVLIPLFAIGMLIAITSRVSNDRAQNDRPPIKPLETKMEVQEPVKVTTPVERNPPRVEAEPTKPIEPEKPKIDSKPIVPVEPVKPKPKWSANATIGGTKLAPIVMAKFGFKIDEYRDASVFNPTKAKKMIADQEIALVVDAIAVAVETRAKGFAYFRPTEGKHEGQLFVAYDNSVIGNK